MIGPQKKEIINDGCLGKHRINYLNWESKINDSNAWLWSVKICANRGLNRWVRDIHSRIKFSRSSLLQISRSSLQISSPQLSHRLLSALGLQLKHFQFCPLRAALTASFDHEAFGCNQGLNNTTRSGSAR